MNSVNSATKSAKLVSQLLLEDADLRDLVEQFVAGLETRLSELNSAHEKLDFATLTTLVHRLKGAAGSYGYPGISRVCAEMEAKFKFHQADNFANFLGTLANFAAAAKAGLGAEP